MDAKGAYITISFLAIGVFLNFGYPVVAEALSIPVAMEFIIIAYCLVVMLVPLRMREAVGIGIIAGILTILSDVVHLTTVLSMHASRPALFMALFNLISEPAGITICFLAFAYLAGRIRNGAPFAAAFLATLASGLAYLAMIFLFNPGLIAAQPAYTESFLLRVVTAAVVNAVVVQIMFMAVGRPVKAYLGGLAE
jgi:hypothetical protein